LSTHLLSADGVKYCDSIGLAPAFLFCNLFYKKACDEKKDDYQIKTREAKEVSRKWS